MLLSTMSSYVTAMGGSLKLIAEFPNRGPVAIRLADLQTKMAESAENAIRTRERNQASFDSVIQNSK